jgi:hypothetical protein
MSAYVVAQYRVTNPEAFQQYPPAVIPHDPGARGRRACRRLYRAGDRGAAPTGDGGAALPQRRGGPDLVPVSRVSGDQALRLDNSEAGAVVIAEEFVLPT